MEVHVSSLTTRPLLCYPAIHLVPVYTHVADIRSPSDRLGLQHQIPTAANTWVHSVQKLENPVSPNTSSIQLIAFLIDPTMFDMAVETLPSREGFVAHSIDIVETCNICLEGFDLPMSQFAS